MLTGSASSALAPKVIAGILVADRDGAALPEFGLAQQAESATVGQVIPLYSDAEALRAGAQSVVDAFHARTVATGLDLGSAPTVEVRTTPQTAFYSGNRGKIVVASWDDVGPEVQAMFARMADGGAADGERLFRATVHHFVIAHEAGHWLRHRSDTRPATRYTGENDANRLAVAFWRMQPGGEVFLAEFERMMRRHRRKYPRSHTRRRGSGRLLRCQLHEARAGPDPLQLHPYRFVLDALRERSRLDFYTRSWRGSQAGADHAPSAAIPSSRPSILRLKVRNAGDLMVQQRVMVR